MKKINSLIKQFFKFIGISGFGWLIDVLFFSILTTLKIATAVSNIISSTIAITFVYFVSTNKIFKGNNITEIRAKYLIYIIYQCIVIFTFSIIIEKISLFILAKDILFLSDFHNIIAKICVTPFTMTINFIFMKVLMGYHKK